jgi:anhydro-N-acetylmuramic acid kinase
MSKIIIGNMTGNSMDAVDLVATRFENGSMTDLGTLTQPYSNQMRKRVEALRLAAYNKTKAEIISLPDFESFHHDYISQIAECIDRLCQNIGLNPLRVDAIGFHGKTLDHNPPSRAKAEGTLPYTLQIGSGKMLADLTGITVVYDFRSAPLMLGLEGAPLVGLHNAHIAAVEGNGIYYNGGNTSNFALITNQKNILSADSGPCNEYIDSWIRQTSDLPFDTDGKIGQKGVILPDLMGYLFDMGRVYYERPLPKSGDPAYYHKDKILAHLSSLPDSNENIVHTLEYFSAYVAAQALMQIPQHIDLPNQIILFGGGWKNPIVRQSFENILCGEAFILPEHQTIFKTFQKRFLQKPKIFFSSFGTYMEARLFADMAYFRLENKPWIMSDSEPPVLCGQIAVPQKDRKDYDDMVNLAAKGWQSEKRS